MILTSFFIGLIVAATFLSIEKPAEKLIDSLNQNNHEESKKQLRYLLQADPGSFKKLDSELITNPELLQRISTELSEEYITIAQKHAGEKLISINNCDDVITAELALDNLQNALRLVDMAEAIDGNYPGLIESLTAKADKLKNEISSFKDKCNN